MMAWILFGVPGVLPGAVIGIITGIASGAAMLPYTVIKEVNPPQLGGTATGVINFLNFTFSALLGPVFGWLLVKVSEGGEQMELRHYQAGFHPLLYGVGIVLILTFFVKETGSAAKASQKTSAPVEGTVTTAQSP
jgi:MFS family permease